MFLCLFMYTIAPCPSGQEYNTATTSCEPCAINFYKDNAATVNGEYATCTECPANLNSRTAGTGSTSLSDCSVGTYSYMYMHSSSISDCCDSCEYKR